MPTIKLGRRELKALTDHPPGAAVTYFDEETPGFGVRLTPAGHASYVLHYRPQPGGRKTPKRVVTIGAVGSMTLEAAKKAAGDMKANIRVAKPGEGADPMEERQAKRRAATLEELVRSYLDEHVKPDRKPATLALYEGYLRKHIAPRRDDKDPTSPLLPGALGAKKATAVTVKAVNDLRLNIGETHERTANATVTLIAAAYAWGAKHGRVPTSFANPAKGVGRFRENSRERALNADELARLGDTLALAESEGLSWEPRPGPKAKHARKERRVIVDKHAVACIRLLAFTGCRLREILNLEWTSVSFTRGDEAINLPDSKTGRRRIPLTAPSLAILTVLYAERVGKYVIPSESAGAPNEKPRADLHRPWRRIVSHAKLGDLRIHDLRHTFATAALAGHKDIVIVSKMLGHKDIRTTMKYSHLADDYLRQAKGVTATAIEAQMAGNSAPVVRLRGKSE